MFFTKIFIDQDNELRVEHNRPFEMLLDPQVNANTLTWAADAHKARTSTNVPVGKGSSLVRGVGVWSVTGTGDHGSRGLLPSGIRASMGKPILPGGLTTR